MSTPAQSYYAAGGRCCDGRDPVPFYVLAMPFGVDNQTTFREALRQSGIDADEPWCHGCGNVLENIRDGFQAGGGTFLRLVATIAAFVPGIGTGIAIALAGAASLAEGNTITEAMHDAAIAAVPGGTVMVAAAESGYAILQGKGLDEAALIGARSATVAQFGEAAGAAFDVVVAVVQGKTLQDAGFSALRSLVPGNELIEQASGFADAMGRAASTGRDVRSVLLEDLRAELAAAAPGRVRTVLAPVMAYVQNDASSRNITSHQLAFLLNVPEPIARAARIIIPPGRSVDVALLEYLAPTTTESAVDRYGAAVVASKAVNSSWTDITSANREAALVSLVKGISADDLSYGRAVEQINGPPAVVASPARASNSTLGQDVFLGATIAAAIGALYWWASAK